MGRRNPRGPCNFSGLARLIVSVMTCEHARALIDRFVLDELSPAQARTLADHVRGCVACTAELAGASRLIELLATLPEVAPSPEFEARIFAAVVADRQRRHAHRSWLGDLRAQILRGTLRTTGTFAATVALVALLAVGGVWAASNLFMGPLLSAGVLHDGTPRPTLATPTGTPTGPAAAVPLTPAPAPTVTPRVIVITVTPSPAPSERPTLRPSTQPTPAPVVLAAPTASPSAAPVASAGSSPTPSPTPKCRRTPQGPLCYPASPSPGATGSASP